VADWLKRPTHKLIAIDSMIPIGCDQQELIIGDPQTSKAGKKFIPKSYYTDA
jgi:F0F1-type ATP synthase alpha subunit